MLEAIRYVDLVIPEENWSQKIDDIKKYQVDLLVMGDDWSDSEKFISLKEYCEIRFLPRTKGISTSKIKRELHLQNPVSGVDQLPESE